MTDHANPWLLAFLIAGCGVCLAVIVVPLWRLRRRKNGHEPTELDNDQPVSGVHGTGKPGIKPPVFINTIGRE